MKRFCAILFLSLTLSACGGRTSVKALSVIPACEINLTDESLQRGLGDTLQLGRMNQGEIIAQIVRLHNHTSEPVVILREATSCGCTTAVYERKPIAVGASLDITIEFNSQGQMGWQMKLMEFYMAEKATPLKIYIDAEVE